MSLSRDKISRKRFYSDDFEGRADVVLSDVVEIAPDQLIKVTFLSTNSQHRQGIRLAIEVGKGYLEIEDTKGARMHLWTDTSPEEIIVRCVSPAGLLSVYNIWWRDGASGCDALLYGSGMLIDEEDGKFTYHCNDLGIETNFDKLVFTLEKL